MSDLSHLFRKLAEEQDALRARSSARDALRQRLASLEVHSPRQRRPRIRRWAASLVAAAALFAGVLVYLTLPGRELLEVRVGESSAPPLIGAWLGAPDDERLPLLFSDGTRLELAPRSRARLREMRPEGARVELGSGTLRVNVVPRATTDYWIHAGPFAVHVTGTRFDVRFDPKDQSFTLSLEEGHVELSGCVFGKSRRLAAGQTVHASCTKRTLEVEYGDRLPPSTPPTPDVSAVEAQANERTETSAAPVPSPQRVLPPKRELTGRAPPPAGDTWAAAAERGAYTQAFERAKRAGFEAECARSNAQQLAALADSARLAGAFREAKHALLTLRSRFPNTDEAALAAFTLGRMEFDGARPRRSSITWFQTYLKEQPRGPMKREAIGRLIEAFQATGDLPAARALASSYLREYPSGPHAELASRVLAGP